MDNRILEIIIRARDEATKVIERAGDSITSNFKKAKDASETFALGLLGVGTAAAGIVGMGAKVAGDLETSRQGFITLLGSAEEADKILTQIKVDAAKTPFELPGLIQANQLLTSVTKDGQRSETFLLNIGRALAAMGKGQNELDRIIVNLQQIGAVGKSSMLDLKQFAFAGIPIFDLLQQHTGKTGQELEDMIANGEVTFTLLEELFNKAGSAGGQFARAFTDQSGTFNQSLSNAKDTLTIFLAELVTTTGVFDLLKDALKGFVAFMNEHGDEILAGIRTGISWIRDNGPIVAGIILGALTPAMLAFAGAVIGATIALAPYLIAGAALGLLAKVIMDNWSPISGFFVGLWRIVTGAFQAASTFIMQTVPQTVNGIVSWFQQLPARIRGAILALPGIVAGIFASVKDAAIGKVVELWTTLSGWWNKIRGIFDAIRGAADAAIGAVRSGLEAGGRIGFRGFADGGWVNGTGPAIVHDKEYVLSRDMLAGRQSIDPSILSRLGGSTSNVQVGPVYVRSESDAQSLAHRLDYLLRTSGNL